MANHNAYVYGMGLEGQTQNRLYPNGRVTAAVTGPIQVQSWSVRDGELLEALEADGFPTTHGEGTPMATVPTDHDAHSDDQMGAGADFWERLIERPLRIDAGLVLGTVEYSLIIYNSYRHDRRLLSTYTNNAGAGIVIPDLPTLPYYVEEQSELSLTIRILTEGPAEIDGTLDFGFDTRTIIIPITGQRSIVFPFEPIRPMAEVVAFLTDVITKRDGTEQRISLRETPRRFIEVTVDLEGHARRFYETVTYSGQGRASGVPLWWESVALTQAASAGAGTLYVTDTLCSEFDADGQALLYLDEETYEVVALQAVGSTFLSLDGTLVGSFPIGTRVVPIKIGFMNQTIRASKWPVNMQRARVRFMLIGDEADIASTSGWSAYNGKVLLTDPAGIDDQLNETLSKKITTVDSETGTFELTTEEDVGRRTHTYVFRARTPADVCRIRALLYALRGRAISFYVPTFYEELEPTQAISAGSNTIRIKSISYNKFVDEKAPRDVIRVVKTNGDTSIRRVTASIQVSVDEEELTVDSNWGINASVDEMKRVDYVEKSRMDSDEITIEHLDGIGCADARIPLRTVVE